MAALHSDALVMHQAAGCREGAGGIRRYSQTADTVCQVDDDVNRPHGKVEDCQVEC